MGRLRLMLGGPRTSTSAELEREISGLVDQGEAQGFITPREGKMIEAVLDLGETMTWQIMVPRTEMATVSINADFADIIKVIVESGHSRIPLYEDDLDHIRGVLHAKDLLPYWSRPTEGISLADIARDPLFVPQSMPINLLLTELKRKRVHLAVVVDEYGGTAGIVTLEDVLEEIVGEIADEYDQDENMLMEQPDGSVLVDGRLDVGDLAEFLGVELPEELPEGRFETVGGFITTILGRVPPPQEEVSYGPVRMVVVGADKRRVTQVQVFATESRAAEVGD